MAAQKGYAVHLVSISYGQSAQFAEEVHGDAVANFLLDRYPSVQNHIRMTMGGSVRVERDEFGAAQVLNQDIGGFHGFRGSAEPFVHNNVVLQGYPSTRDEVISLFAAARLEHLLRKNPQIKTGEVWLATNADDISNFPDISQQNIADMNSILSRKLMAQQGRTVRIETPLIEKTKKEILQYGFEIGAPLELTWSCYLGAPASPCKGCDQCEWREAAFEAIGRSDPAQAPNVISKIKGMAEQWLAKV